jgi:hypothetical protein
MRKTMLLAVLAAPLFAGGFFLQMGNPEANPEARKMHAVLVIQATGCHDPAAAELTATAVGVVKGERRTIPLELKKLSEPGTFALAQQWPREGKWVLRIEGHNGGVFTNALVAAGPEGIDRLHPKLAMKPFSRADVESMLD